MPGRQRPKRGIPGSEPRADVAHASVKGNRERYLYAEATGQVIGSGGFVGDTGHLGRCATCGELLYLYPGEVCQFCQ